MGARGLRSDPRGEYGNAGVKVKHVRRKDFDPENRIVHITEILTAHFFVTRPHYLRTMQKLAEIDLRTNKVVLGPTTRCMPLDGSRRGCWVHGWRRFVEAFLTDGSAARRDGYRVGIFEPMVSGRTIFSSFALGQDRRVQETHRYSRPNHTPS
jgi:hypothetical protein